jgi:hypothetical protein
MQPSSSVSLIEGTEVTDADGSSADASTSSFSGADRRRGPTITIATAEAEVVLDAEDTMFYLSVIQTLLLLAVTIQQIRS